MIPYIANEHSIAAVIDGEQYTITSDNPSFRQVLEAITNGEHPQDIADLFNQANAIKRYMSTADGVVVDVVNGILFFNGEQIHNHVVDRILAFIEQGLPPEPLINFLKRLLENPSKRSIDELYRFCENQQLPITPEGKILTYKGVNENYTDCHTGQVDNRPGAVIPRKKRNDVCDDARKACSNGYHVGALQYATGFGARTVICEVDPADVVSVPFDCGGQKMRVCWYRVVCDYKGALSGTLANASTPYRGFNESY